MLILIEKNYVTAFVVGNSKEEIFKKLDKEIFIRQEKLNNNIIHIADRKNYIKSIKNFKNMQNYILKLL